MFGDADLPMFFGDMGVPIIFNGQVAQGLLDQPIRAGLVMGNLGGVDVAMPELRMPYNAFPAMPAEGDTVTISGANYTVAGIAAEGDGAVLCVTLKAA